MINSLKRFLGRTLGEVKLGGGPKPGGFSPFGKGPDCVADPFRNVSCRFHRQRKTKRTNQEDPRKSQKRRTRPDRETPRLKPPYLLSGPFRLSSIAVEHVVENRGLYRVFVWCLFPKGFRHHSPTIARLSPLSGLERGG